MRLLTERFCSAVCMDTLIARKLSLTFRTDFTPADGQLIRERVKRLHPQGAAHVLRMLANALPTTARLHAEDRRDCWFCGAAFGDGLVHLMVCRRFATLVYEATGRRISPKDCFGFRRADLTLVVCCCELYLQVSHFHRDLVQYSAHRANLAAFARAAWLKATSLA